LTTFRAIFVAVVVATALMVGAILLHERRPRVERDALPRPARSEAPLADRILYGAPPFAPLLFADLALLGALGAASLRSA
jgi:hypothetical protein